MKPILPKVLTYLFLLSFAFSSHSQITTIYTSPTTWNVPAGVSTISIKVYGGGGGTGGQDCGDGCTNAAGGLTGFAEAVYTVSPGNTIGIYPGGKGEDGADNESGYGGGAGGIDTYPFGAYNGGRGGDAGYSGASGGGGGGGAASVITINSTIMMVAGGAGGGGGMANLTNSGFEGNPNTNSNGSTTGGDGAYTFDDGGGGGGGGGGQQASFGGNLHYASGEEAGDGGYRGENYINGASAVLKDGSINWNDAGRIEISYMNTLPVTWLSFTAIRNNKATQLNWSTATEQNTQDFQVQRSSNGSDWFTIGKVNAAGNSMAVQYYYFTDQRPLTGMNYYRLLQRDIDHKLQYSKVLFCDWTLKGTGLKIYPNPVINGSTAIYLPAASTIRLFNSAGKEVMKKDMAAGSSLLDLSILPKGAYYLRSGNEMVSLLVQ